MGLRISEVFGVLVDDVVDLGAGGLLIVQGQGGRTFTVRDDHGVVVAVSHKETMKTAAGFRVLVAPESMMRIFRVAIDAFHTDPATGTIDDSARLVPGLREANRSGQLGYRQAFEKAIDAEKLGSGDLGFRVTPHLLRKSLATDLAWARELTDVARRRFMGHRASDDVFGRIYTLDHPGLAPLREVANVLEANIADTIAMLFVPTTRRMSWGKSTPQFSRSDFVETTLIATKWLVDPGDTLLWSAHQVATELNVARTTARRWLRDGTLPSVVVVDLDGVRRRRAQQRDVLVHRDSLRDNVSLTRLANELGISYHALYQRARRLGLHLQPSLLSRQLEVSDDAAAILRGKDKPIGCCSSKMRGVEKKSERL
jgi:hypothetical protein